MAGNFFSDKSGKSYYYNSISLFINERPDTILGSLTRHAFDQSIDQRDAWINQIGELQEKLGSSGCSGDIIFEYDIIRLGKRIDVILLIKHMVFSLEFKNGAKKYFARDAEQAEDYALDLKNFHKESENLYVCPILIATEAEERENVIGAYNDKQIFLQYANKNNMLSCIENVYNKYGDEENIDFDKWYNSQYCPTPTIIAAAVEAFVNNTVDEIAHSEAGQDDIEECEAEVSKIVNYAKSNNKKCICFVTGVPGAGKTLVGLKIASNNLSIEDNTKAVYISGNGPLVKVLRKALNNNAIARHTFQEPGKTKAEIKKRANDAVVAFIQDAYGFRKEHLIDLQQFPPENVLVFDEAQRCWSKEKLTDFANKKGLTLPMEESEPQCFLEIMNRRRDWSVVVCLVGLGQDIYDGEIGINEWFRTAINDYNDWELFYSPKIFEQLEDRQIDKNLIINCNRAKAVNALHLSTSIRSFRSEIQSEFVDNLLANNYIRAKELYSGMLSNYPLYITRDIKKAKSWVRAQVRGSQRSGVIACSSAQRLKPDGIYVPTEIDVENWFLAPKEDLRSSNALEVVASEFKVQGLEIDWALVCWDADLRRKGEDWDYYSFRGTRWNKRNKPEQQRYLLNAYRVLLTRARQGMVIFVPTGEDPQIDQTRDYKFYNEIYYYLHGCCGIQELPELT